MWLGRKFWRALFTATSTFQQAKNRQGNILPQEGRGEKITQISTR